MEQNLNNHVVEPVLENNSMNTHYQQEFNQDMADKASITTYTASAFTALWGALTFEHVVALFGLMIGFIGLAVNIYFKRREDQRAHERHMKYMAERDQPNET